MTKIKSLAIQSNLPDPAMAGDEWLREAFKLATYLSVYGIGSKARDEARAAFRAHLLKRVQPASGDDAKRIAWLSENDCMIERLVSTKGTKYRLSWVEEWQADWYDTPGQAIDAAMQHGGRSCRP